MNSVFLLIAIFLISAIITFVILCCYIKFLAVTSRKLRHALYKVSEARSDARKDSSIEICCIQCFDSTYNILYTYWGLVCRAIKDFIWNKGIGKNSYNSEKECGDKNRNGNVKSFLPSRSHINRIISRKQPNANNTLT
ncbi:hypothetical protein ES703_39368 [subsurface metagenome]